MAFGVSSNGTCTVIMLTVLHTRGATFEQDCESAAERIGTVCGLEGNVCRRSTVKPASDAGKGGFAVTGLAGVFPGTRTKIVMTCPGAASVGLGVAYPAPVTTAWAWQIRG